MVSWTGSGPEACPKHHRGTTMEHHAGIDVSLELSSVCVVDATGRIVREAKVASEPEALIAWFRGLDLGVSRVGLEAGPLSQWLYAAMRGAGLAAELLETRHVRDAFKAMPVRTDRKDARGIAQLMRLGWFRPVHCKSVPAQERRALLETRKRRQAKPNAGGGSAPGGGGAARGAGVLPPGARQVGAGAGDAGAADDAEAAAGQAPRRGDEPARDAARLRAEGGADCRRPVPFARRLPGRAL